MRNPLPLLTPRLGLRSSPAALCLTSTTSFHSLQFSSTPSLTSPARTAAFSHPSTVQPTQTQPPITTYQPRKQQPRRNNPKNKMASTSDAQDLADHLEDVAISSTKQARGGGGGGGRGRGGAKRSGEGGRGKREVDLSRALSRLLRHQAGNAGVELDREGFADLGRVLEWGPLRALAPTFDEILNAVHNSDKQRFAIKPNPATNPSLDESSTTPSHWLIRANQGHSIQLASEHLLKPLAAPVPSDGGPKQPEGTLPIPPTVVHGTYFAFWPAILASGGLKPMGRNHVHCSTGLPEDAEAGVISGMRRDAELLIYVDVEASIRDGGIKWWMSDNGVVLTEGGEGGVVPVEYFRLVEGRRQGVGVLWKDGEKVADLPEGLKARAPQGKRGGRGGGRGGRGGRGRGQ